MGIYNICAISSGSLSDLSVSLRDALIERGHQAYYRPGTIVPDATNILLDSVMISDWSVVPQNSIIFNLEQLNSDSKLVTAAYLDKLSQYRVWDYSQRNVEFMARRGIEALYTPIGYSKSLTRSVTSDVQDIDILFYGSINERRLIIIDELKRFAKVFVATGIYGEDLLAIIARSKLVVNMHYYDSRIFEAVRVSLLLANRKAVVAEINQDTDTPDFYRDLVCPSSYLDLVGYFGFLLKPVNLRLLLEKHGFDKFQACLQSSFLPV